MKITEDVVNHIAHLSKLQFEGESKKAIQQDLENIVSFMEVLGEVDTENVEPLIFMNDDINVLREDVPAQTIQKEEALSNAPKRDSDYFRIPKVLDK